MKRRIPAHAHMKVIRPKTQLSGGIAPVSLRIQINSHVIKTVNIALEERFLNGGVTVIFNHVYTFR